MLHGQGWLSVAASHLISRKPEAWTPVAHRVLSDAEAAELRAGAAKPREAEGVSMPAAWKSATCLVTGEPLHTVLPPLGSPQALVLDS